MSTKPAITPWGSFSDDQLERIHRQLRSGLPKEFIKSRPGAGGRKVDYIEGGAQLEIANFVFGATNWSSSILSITQDFLTEDRGRWHCGVTALVRVQLANGSYHEDLGYGAGLEKSMAASIEKAKKGAVTDARKRALRCFGELLGNSLKHKDDHTNSSLLTSEDLPQTPQSAAAKKRPAPASAVSAARKNPRGNPQAGASASPLPQPQIQQQQQPQQQQQQPQIQQQQQPQQQQQQPQIQQQQQPQQQQQQPQIQQQQQRQPQVPQPQRQQAAAVPARSTGAGTGSHGVPSPISSTTPASTPVATTPGVQQPPVGAQSKFGYAPPKSGRVAPTAAPVATAQKSTINPYANIQHSPQDSAQRAPTSGAAGDTRRDSGSSHHSNHESPDFQYTAFSSTPHPARQSVLDDDFPDFTEDEYAMCDAAEKAVTS